MLFAKRTKGYFCIANSNFEGNGEVTVIVEQFDEKFIMPIIQRASAFWEKAVFPKLMQQ